MKSNVYTCTIKSTNLIGDPFQINGQHNPSQSEETVLTLNVVSSNATLIPSEFFLKFPNLKFLRMQTVNLKVLSESESYLKELFW